MKLWSAIFVICLPASTVQGIFAVKESGTDAGKDSRYVRGRIV